MIVKKIAENEVELIPEKTVKTADGIEVQINDHDNAKKYGIKGALEDWNACTRTLENFTDDAKWEKYRSDCAKKFTEARTNLLAVFEALEEPLPDKPEVITPTKEMTDKATANLALAQEIKAKQDIVRQNQIDIYEAKIILEKGVKDGTEEIIKP